MTVEILLPGALADLIGGTRRLDVELPQPATVGGLLAILADRQPVLHRRLCDETGSLRRFVNVYVDGDDVRRNEGLQTAVAEGSTVQILPSIAGGAPLPPLFHIATLADWQAAQATGRYERSTRGQTLGDVGFIHCSFGDQVRDVARAIYADCDEPLVLLQIDPDAVPAEIRVESLDGGAEAYPHIYGPLPAAAVTDVTAFSATAIAPASPGL